MAAIGKVKRSTSDLPRGVERLKDEHRKVRSNVYFHNNHAFLQILFLMFVNVVCHRRLNDLSSMSMSFLLYICSVARLILWKVLCVSRVAVGFLFANSYCMCVFDTLL